MSIGKVLVLYNQFVNNSGEVYKRLHFSKSFIICVNTNTGQEYVFDISNGLDSPFFQKFKIKTIHGLRTFQDVTSSI